MSDLASVIRQIRRRLGLTTRQFAQRLGVRHTAISRWERGQMQPGFLALKEILKVAEGTEKNPVLERLIRLLKRSGLAGDSALIQLGRAGILVDLRPLDRRLVWEERPPGVSPAGPNLAEFFGIATAIIHRAEEVDRSLVDILRFWRDHNTTDDAVRGYFADAAKFLAVSLATWEARQREAGGGPPADEGSPPGAR
jgi:transcriptional regulator with XRE-family HTH domain